MIVLTSTASEVRLHSISLVGDGDVGAAGGCALSEDSWRGGGAAAGNVQSSKTKCVRERSIAVIADLVPIGIRDCAAASLGVPWSVDLFSVRGGYDASIVGIAGAIIRWTRSCDRVRTLVVRVPKRVRYPEFVVVNVITCQNSIIVGAGAFDHGDTIGQIPLKTFVELAMQPPAR